MKTPKTPKVTKRHGIDVVLVTVNELSALQTAAMEAQQQVQTLAAFARWAISEGAWQAGDLDGLDIQEKAEKLGLIVREPGGYDEAKHGPSDFANPGDEFFVYAPWVRGDFKP